jgi:hypothetical protein
MKASNFSFHSTLSASAVALALMAQSAYATPINITATLTGDIRLDSPDNLIVNVTIVGDTTSNQATWTVDINSPAHLNIKLDEFYFNMGGAAGNYSFSGFNPTGWNINTPATIQGAGFPNGVTFMFEALDPVEQPNVNAPDVTNSQSLSFVMTYASGNLTDALFLNAPASASNDAGSGQLGAHLQSLTTAGNCGNSTNCSDSGFAFGVYQGGGTPPFQVPEPGALFLMGAGLLGLGMVRRRKSV